MNQPSKFLVATILLGLVGILACNIALKDDFRNQYHDSNEILHIDTTQSSFYKLHFHNGDVAILNEWFTADTDLIKGFGTLYDFKRKKKSEGIQSFHISEVVIGETNDHSLFKSYRKELRKKLEILVAFNLAVNTACIINPKVCFGSCPTFYIEGNDDLRNCNAEGFSHAISPSLASTDIDALQHVTPGEVTQITLKNEALETHVIDKVGLIAAPKSSSNQVLQSDDRYYECKPSISPVKASGDILSSIVRLDNEEYFMLADSTDLFSADEIIVEFNQLESANNGVVINFRQSLMTTFLLYNALSYLGDEATDYMAKFETNERIQSKMFDPLLEKSIIKLDVWNEAKSKWDFVQKIYEIGPIAKNKIIIPLESKYQKSDSVKLRFRMPKGHWRIDYVGLAEIVKEIAPLHISPHDVVFNGMSDAEAVLQLGTIDKANLITIPGDEAILRFQLPCVIEGMDYELFLSSHGYYLEWMRREWLQDKNISGFKKMMSLDKGFWRKLAVEYKAQEAESEAIFWSSNIEKLEL